LSFPNGGQYFDNFTYSCADTALYGLVRGNSTIHLGKVNALTGEVTKIGTQALGATSFSVNGSATIDPVNMIYYFISGSGTGLTIYGVSLQSGLVVSQETISNTGALYFDMMRIQSDCYESLPTRLAPSSSLPDSELKPETVQVAPNPFADQVHITSKAELQKIELYQANGVLLYTVEVTSKECTLETSMLHEGMYLLQITTAQGVQSVKILK